MFQLSGLEGREKSFPEVFSVPTLMGSSTPGSSSSLRRVQAPERPATEGRNEPEQGNWGRGAVSKGPDPVVNAQRENALPEAALQVVQLRHCNSQMMVGGRVVSFIGLNKIM